MGAIVSSLFVQRGLRSSHAIEDGFRVALVNGSAKSKGVIPARNKSRALSARVQTKGLSNEASHHDAAAGCACNPGNSFRSDLPGDATCTPTGFYRDGIDLTAAKIGGKVTGDLDATGCDIGVYYGPGTKGSVKKATIKNAKYFGVVNYRGKVNVKNSTISQIGNTPFDGSQHGVGILYTTEKNPRRGDQRHRRGHDQRQRSSHVPEERDRRSRCRRVGEDRAQHADRRWACRLHRPERDPGLVRRQRDGQGQHRLRTLVHAGYQRSLRAALLPGGQGRRRRRRGIRRRRRRRRRLRRRTTRSTTR